MIPARGILIPSLCALAFAVPREGPAQSFDTMAQPAENDETCKAPRPPKNLAETAYIRNGYRAILRIMAAEKWLETRKCECFLADLTWEEVVNGGEKYINSANPKRPFDTSELRILADELEKQREKACAQ